MGCPHGYGGPARRVVANLARCAGNPWGIALRPAPSGRTQPRGNSVASIWSKTTLTGRCVYTDDEGERLEIEGGDAAFFPAGWDGTCEVLETVRKTYMIR
jgi:hypothetical protein